MVSRGGEDQAHTEPSPSTQAERDANVTLRSRKGCARAAVCAMSHTYSMLLSRARSAAWRARAEALPVGEALLWITPWGKAGRQRPDLDKDERGEDYNEKPWCARCRRAASSRDSMRRTWPSDACDATTYGRTHMGAPARPP